MVGEAAEAVKMEPEVLLVQAAAEAAVRFHERLSMLRAWVQLCQSSWAQLRLAVLVVHLQRRERLVTLLQ